MNKNKRELYDGTELTALPPLSLPLKQNEMAVLDASGVLPGDGAAAERPYPGPPLAALEESP